MDPPNISLSSSSRSNCRLAGCLLSVNMVLIHLLISMHYHQNTKILFMIKQIVLNYLFLLIFAIKF